MTERIAVIGMGQMGSAMASRLSEAQYDVMGYDINEATRQALEAQGVNMADSLAAALAGRTTVLTSLPDPNAVKAPGWATAASSPWPSRTACWWS